MKPQYYNLTKILSNSREYLKFLFAEFISYINYTNAFFIGITVNFFSGQNFPGKLAPYIIPIIVQSLSKSAVKYKNRHMERILKLPSEREDPVFIMSKKGDIILSTGLTFEKLKSHGVNNICQIISDDGFEYISNCLSLESISNVHAEVYSELFNAWYEIKMKPTHSGSSKMVEEYLIWFTDISQQKDHESRMSNMLRFSDNILSSLPAIISKYDIDDIYAMLAEFILSNVYDGVFITRMDEKNNLKGYVFKYKNGIIKKSNQIKIHHNSPAPIFHSRQKSTIVSADILTFKSRDEFEKEYPFDERVKSFLSNPINNFINYHSENVSIIAFNKNGVISKYDKILIKIIVNNLKTILTLADDISSYYLDYIKSMQNNK